MARGDIVFTTSNSFISKLIRRITGGPWSHVAMDIGDNRVIESDLGYGVRFNDIKNYEKYELYYVDGISDKDINSIIDEFSCCVGKKYDLISQIGICFRILCHNYCLKFISFHGKNKLNSDGFFCSEIIHSIFLKNGKELVKLSSSYVTPRDLYHSELIKRRSE